jgi:pimeloyl-ACP methyl ester carboxylesterase
MRPTTFVALVALLAAGTACTRSEPPAPATEPTRQVAPQLPPPPQAQAREARVKSLAGDGSEIRYRVYGAGEPAIVFVHGWSCDSGYWDAQLNHFAAKYTVITVDLAGHGESSENQRKYWSMAHFGADVAGAVRDAGVGRVVLVGSSMGGTVALEAARLLPGQVIGIVGVDTFRDIATPYPKEMTDSLLASMRADFAQATKELVGDDFFTERTDPILKKWIVNDMAAAPPEVAIPSLVAYLGMEYGPLLEALDLPVIALNSVDSPTDEAATRRLEPRFRVVPLEGVGHFPMLEQPDMFNRVLASIVAEWVRLEPARNPLSGAAPAG